MLANTQDQEVVALLAEKLGVTIDKCEYNEQGRLIKLNLAGLALVHLPSEIGLLSELQELDLSENKLSEVPSEIGQLGELQELVLHHNQLSKLPSEIRQLGKLRYLDLDANRLGEVQDEIWHLNSLNTLYLDNNQLNMISYDVAKLTNLKCLTLSENQLKELPLEISQLSNLEELYMDENQLANLPEPIGQLTHLQTLSVDENQLTNLPEQIGLLTNLLELSVGKNQLSHLPDQIGLLISLQKLYVHENQLVNLPDQIGHLTNLQTLFIRNNRLRDLPSTIWQLKGLQELTIVGNQLSELSSEIGQLTQLKKLWIWGIKEGKIPKEIWQLHNLQVLDVSQNELQELPAEVGHLTNLLEFYADENQLTSLPEQIGHLTNLQTLSVKKNLLTSLPEQIGHLINLQTLYVDENQLTSLPEQIEHLTHLQALYAGENQLTRLPEQIGHLINLQTLYVDENQLASLPEQIEHLTHLQELSMRKNQLTNLPEHIGRLTNLQTLFIQENQLTNLPEHIGRLMHLQALYASENQLTSLPEQIGHLINLQTLYVDENQIASLPEQIGQLTSLQNLMLTENRLRDLPATFSQLRDLQQLAIGGNQLNELSLEISKLTQLRKLWVWGLLKEGEIPQEIWQLKNLQLLDLGFNKLKEFPTEMCLLKNLQELYLYENQLSSLPKEISLLNNLQVLDLRDNQLRGLPVEIGMLSNLQTLDVNDNPDLLTPPPEIVTRGVKEIVNFFQELQNDNIKRYEAKLLVVGEGGTGKSSLLRALHNDTFNAHLLTTHGIEVGKLELPHTQHDIILNTWDFGGQHIYHSTHQFFLTKRSLYLVVWNARLGADQGRLHYWLETIKVLAPGSPVLLVATHTDERSPDLNYQLYKDAYPQLVGSLSVSNYDGSGIMELKARLAQEASQLPLMGQPWPSKWLAVEKALLERTEQYIDARTYVECCIQSGGEEEVVKGTLGNYLHDLGKILYFRDDYVLSNMVVLKPNWVTRAISHVLDDENTSRAKGILLHIELPRIWATDDEDGRLYEPHLYPVFLRLMERFELSYQIEAEVPGEHPTSSLIPLLLPHQPPVELPPWPKNPLAGQSQVEMVYRLEAVPAGIMSRFIVRTHRYSKNLHWREGVMLEYQGHQARAELNPLLRELRLIVQGPLPQNFFSILMHTVDAVLARFEGLTIRREIPCICHWENKAAEPCPRFYRYEDLVRRMQADRHNIECPDTFSEVSVPLLLYGIHSSTNEQVMKDIQQGQRELKQELRQGQQELQKNWQELHQRLDQQSELIARDFTRLWNWEMQKIDAECPNTFVLRAGGGSMFNPKNLVSHEYTMHLVCQHPNGPHCVGKGYSVHKAEEWWKTISPWLNNLVTFFKYAVPLGKAVGVVFDAIDFKPMEDTLDMVNEVVGDIPEIAAPDSMKSASGGYLVGRQQAAGSALRVLYNFLKEVDPDQAWGGLRKTATPDGNIFWLCEEHRKQYEVRPLVLP